MTRIDMTTREWHELIRPVLPHTINDKDFPELDVIRLELGETALYAVATDRYTLAAERWPLTGPGLISPGRREVVHLSAREVAASLKLFTHSKDDDPALSIMLDEVPTSVTAIGQLHSVMRLGVTVQQLGDGTRLVLHDVRDPSRDPLSAWRKTIRTALARPSGRALDGLDLYAGMLARWTAAARKGERLTMYTGPAPGDPLLVIVEEHFAGVWMIPQYLDGPGKTLAGLPWHDEIHDDDDSGRIDLETGERLEGGGAS